MVPGDTEGQLCVNYTSHSLDVSLTYHDWSAVPNAGGFVCTGSGCLDAQIRSMASLAEKLDRVIIQHPEAIMSKKIISIIIKASSQSVSDSQHSISQMW